MSSNKPCVLASGNAGKLAELATALQPYHIQLVPQGEYDVSEADETAVTFLENALIKARHASLATGLPALADDSGLVVPVLDGAPGIYSARYALLDHAPFESGPFESAPFEGETSKRALSKRALSERALSNTAQSVSTRKPSDKDNILKLLNALQDRSGDERVARFVCVLAYLAHANDPEPVIATGYWQGTITDTLEGSGGFGYDPVFYCPQSGLTAAAMGKDRKREISHRAVAIKSLQQQLQQRFQVS